MDASSKRDLYVPHRNYVAHNANFDTGITVFQVLLSVGLKSTSRVCDVGCGSLRVGRYLITHLERGLYYCIEPNTWLVDAAREHEVGTMWDIKNVAYSDDSGMDPGVFGERFDFVLISSVLAHASHNQITAALANSAAVGARVVFDTVPNGGPDHTGDHWLYPQVASHYDECVIPRCPREVTKLHIGEFGEQWWVL